jgi:hypothetical protein
MRGGVKADRVRNVVVVEGKLLLRNWAISVVVVLGSESRKTLKADELGRVVRWSAPKVSQTRWKSLLLRWVGCIQSWRRATTIVSLLQRLQRQSTNAMPPTLLIKQWSSGTVEERVKVTTLLLLRKSL